MSIQRRARIMSRMMPGMVLALAMISGLATMAHADSFSVPTEVTYHTKANDTLIDLARRYFNRVEDYRVVQQINHVAVPQHLQPGIDLRIPVAILRGTPVTATVISFRGDVRLGEDHHNVTAGATLTEGTRIETGAASFLSFRAADGSTVTMPSQSVMRIERMRRILFTNTLDQQFAVEHGRLETTVAKQVGPGSHYEVRTPIAVSAVRGTVFRVAYDEAAAGGASLTEVLGGTVAVGAPGAHQTLPVPIGIGAAVAHDGSVRTENLLPAPALADGNRLQAGRNLRFGLAPVPGAVGYHMQIARDAAFQDVVAETRSAQPEGRFDALPDGAWFLRATALSSTGFEGLPATQSFERHPHAFDATLTRTSGHEYRVAWDYAGEAGAHFRVQVVPAPPHATRKGLIALDEDRLFSSALVLDDLPSGAYRWRVGAINGQNEMWTPWRDVNIERSGK
jgi:hypothetical protein